MRLGHNLLWIALFTRIAVNGGVAEAVNISRYDNAAYCTSYCDVYGYYQPAKWCVSQDPTVEVYCCGSQHDRYCCSDDQKDVGDVYDPVTGCPNSSWWHYQWKVIIGLLGTLVVMLMLAACCYYCCGGDSRMPSRSRFMRRRRTQSQQGVVSSTNGENNLSFDPESPNAFTPPDYDSLPKDPPKYVDIFNNVDQQGITNMGCNGSSMDPDPEAPVSTGLSPAPPEYTPTALVAATEDNTTNIATDMDTSVNNNTAIQTQPSDVTLEIPEVSVSRSSSSHSLNETHVTSDSRLLSSPSTNQSNSREEGISHSDVQRPLVGENQEDVQHIQTAGIAHRTEQDDVTVSIITKEVFPPSDVIETNKVTPNSNNQSEEVQHI